MKNRYLQCLEDILEAINLIQTYIGIPRLFAFYHSNKLVQNAVERNLEIIGEAMKRLLEIDSEIPITDARKIIDLRNKISHGYDEISNEQIWGIIINFLPILKNEVEKLFESEGIDINAD